MSSPPPTPLPRRAVELLRRLVALVPTVIRAMRTLAMWSAIAVGIAWVASLALAAPGMATEWISRLAILGIGLVPAAVLLVVASGIDDLRTLPERYRELPAEARTRLAETRREEGEPRRGLLRSIVALVRTAFEAREVLSPLGIVTAALRPALLLAALLAALVALIEIPLAAIVLLVLTA